jgi:hypothetical protein
MQNYPIDNKKNNSGLKIIGVCGGHEIYEALMYIAKEIQNNHSNDFGIKENPNDCCICMISP